MDQVSEGMGMTYGVVLELIEVLTGKQLHAIDAEGLEIVQLVHHALEGSCMITADLTPEQYCFLQWH